MTSSARRGSGWGRARDSVQNMRHADESLKADSIQVARTKMKAKYNEKEKKRGEKICETR